MLQILLVTFPFFALVLGGYVAARTKLLPFEAIPGLNTFVLFFALPCMLYRFGAGTPVARLLDVGVFAIWLGCGLLLMSWTIATTRARVGWTDASFGALVAVFPNSGFMGVPLLVALLGDRAAAPVLVTLITDMVITSSLCVALSRVDATGTHGARRAAINAFRGVAVNPLPWAIVLGCLASASGLALPVPATTVVSMLADAATPTALFTIGAVIARPQHAALEPFAAGRRSDVLRVVACKLLVHPALVLAAGSTAIAAGLPLDRFSLTVLVLVAALPSASNVPMLAERFGADTGRVARIVLVSTTLAFVTFSAAVGLAMRFG